MRPWQNRSIGMWGSTCAGLLIGPVFSSFFLLFGAETLLADANIPELRALTSAYEARLEVLKKPLRDLEKAYEKELNSIKAEAQSLGKPEWVLAVEAEKNNFRKGEFRAPPEGFTSFHRAQSLFQTETSVRSRRIESPIDKLKRKYVSSMQALVGTLTREGRVGEALHVKTKITDFNAVSAPPPKQIVIFWQPNFEGESVKLDVPVTIERFAPHPEMKNDALRSIRIPDGVRVTVGSGAKLEGNTKSFRKDTPDVDVGGGISSLKATVSN